MGFRQDVSKWQKGAIVFGREHVHSLKEVAAFVAVSRLQCKMYIIVILVLFVVGSKTGFSLSKGQDVSALVKASNSLAVQIHREIAPEEEGNIMSSPLGVAIVLGMLCNKHTDNTPEEIRTVLGSKEDDISNTQVHNAFNSILERVRKNLEDKEYLLYLANALFVQKGSHTLSGYHNGCLQKYNATIHEVDFQSEEVKAVNEINDWVKIKTNNKIEKMFENIDSDTDEILLNAVYFKGIWMTPFETKYTTEGVFYNKGVESGKTNIDMMHLVAELPYLRIPGAQMVELSYKGEHISMLILLPDDMKGAYKYELLYTPTEGMNLMRNRQLKKNVTLSFPKFKLEHQWNLNTVNAIKDLFQNNAFLSGVSKAGPILKKPRLVHKAVIEVTEKGSETPKFPTGIVNTTAETADIKFFVNHPFLIAILDGRDENVFFMGRITEL